MATTYTLKNGEKVKINDYVYSAISFEQRDGGPYSIGRILEFLPASDAPKNSKKIMRARLAWVFRLQDMDIRSKDPREVVPAMISETVEVRALRGKCFLLHKDEISDLQAWKKRPDRFWFNKMFDPFIKETYELILSSDVRNGLTLHQLSQPAPENVRKVVSERFSYVAAEKDFIMDLLDDVRLCVHCNDWCAQSKSVQCARCRSFFHMLCVNPPIYGKPARGYGWTCAPCARAHDEAIDSRDGDGKRSDRPPASKAKLQSTMITTRGRGRSKKDKANSETDDETQIRYWQRWPFRYLGQYCLMEDALAEDDDIWGRIPVRVGPKYQAVIPQKLEDGGPFLTGVDERGNDETIDILSNVVDMPDEKVAEVQHCVGKLGQSSSVTRTSVDFLTEVIHRLSAAYAEGKDLSSVNMESNIRLDKWSAIEVPYTDKPWTPQEDYVFTDAILAQPGLPELRLVKDEVGSRSMPEIVRHWGHWKAERVGLANRNAAQSQPPHKRDVTSDDDMTSVVGSQTKHTRQCVVCRTRESKTWWKAAKPPSHDVSCESCGLNFRKYGVHPPRASREETHAHKPKEKRERSPAQAPAAKRAKPIVPRRPSPVITGPQLRCQACHQLGPVGKVIKCADCGVQVHASCCGTVAIDQAKAEGWLCDLCDNKKTQEFSLNTECVLCPLKARFDPRQHGPTADSYLRISKPTEGQGWAHVLCAAFVPEVQYADSASFKLVEGIGALDHYRWAKECSICHVYGGVKIRCTECTADFHVSCAWEKGYVFGFEIQPIKASRRDALAVTNFNGEMGAMNPVVCCRTHDMSRRQVYNICEVNEDGESALQVYSRMYKQAPLKEAHGLLRKARRLDKVLKAWELYEPPKASPTTFGPQCSLCRTRFSPCFYPMESKSEGDDSMGQATSEASFVMCHRCHFKSTVAIATTSVATSSVLSGLGVPANNADTPAYPVVPIDGDRPSQQAPPPHEIQVLQS